MSKVLVAFYSYTGTARRLAQRLCAPQGWAMAEVLERRPRSGAHGTRRCVLDSVFRLTLPKRESTGARPIAIQ